MQIFVKNLPCNVSEKAILHFFTGYDPIGCNIIRNADNACAIVEILGGEKGCRHALKALNNEILEEAQVSLCEVFSKDKKEKE